MRDWNVAFIIHNGHCEHVVDETKEKLGTSQL